MQPEELAAGFDLAQLDQAPWAEQPGSSGLSRNCADSGGAYAFALKVRIEDQTRIHVLR